MKYSIGIIAVLAVVGGLCSGCDKEKEVKPQKAAVEKAADKNWEPETAGAADQGHIHGADCDHDH